MPAFVILSNIEESVFLREMLCILPTCLRKASAEQGRQGRLSIRGIRFDQHKSV